MRIRLCVRSLQDGSALALSARNRFFARARADLRERELDTEVRKPADADLYARTRGAEAAKAE